MKVKKLLALFLICSMVLAGFGSAVTVKADSDKVYIKLSDNKKKVIEANPGEVTHVKVPVVATRTYITKPQIVAKPGNEAPFTAGDVIITNQNVTGEVQGISTIDGAYLEFDITMKDSAGIGIYDLNINLEYTSLEFDEMNGQYPTVNTTLPLTVRVTKEKAPTQITIDKISYNEDAAAIGNSFDLSFVVKNEGEIAAYNTYVKLDYANSGMIPGYTIESIKVGDLKAGESKTIKVPVKVLPTAKEGLQTITATFAFKNIEKKEDNTTKSIYITLKKTSTEVSENAKLTISSNSVNDKVLTGSSYQLKGILENIGKQKATNVVVSIADGVGVTNGVIPKHEAGGIKLADIAVGGKRNFTIPLLVTDTATAGLQEISVQVTYTDSEGETRSAVTKVYLTVIKPEVPEQTGEVVISGAVQNPSSPVVGDRLSVTFNVQNNGNSTITDVTLSGQELSSAGFEPLDSQAIRNIGSLKAGETRTVTLDFKVGANIAEGLNTLTIGCDYVDGNGSKKSMKTPIYILNVINDSNSKPKLIISGYTVDQEELKAGSTFDFTFHIKNTHMSKSAKNIKVTVTQAENVFSATQGSNSFYIPSIGPGAEYEQTMNMKVKSDVTTGAYEIELTFEYEYDGMNKVDQEAGGVKTTDKLKLQAMENLRPSIQNFTVGMYGEMPTVGITSSMTFEFINMGKSPLNNVRFSLDGDFTLDNGGTTFYLGTIAPGSPEYVEIPVMPQVEGTASGTLYILFEDSTGEEVSHPYEFKDIMVNGSYVPEITPEVDIPSINDNPSGNVAKDIMAPWLFVVIQFAILVVFIPVARLVVIKIQKRKLQKQDSNF
ncbi:COG1361 S-layer family protein [Lachnoclostridium sp.]|uniref:COG1361 S-layer family protein n=1 Tax=Lachnoclostridium sp. TaxID=2028282 RepID=UPI00289C67FC|nr:CARDB domain-containing protein [Lachnoclostridium sp.]